MINWKKILKLNTYVVQESTYIDGLDDKLNKNYIKVEEFYLAEDQHIFWASASYI